MLLMPLRKPCPNRMLGIKLKANPKKIATVITPTIIIDR